MVFEVLIIEKPTEKEEEDGKLERIVVEPKCVVAKTQQSAILKALMDAKEIREFDIDRTEVLVRPFAAV